MDAAYAAYVRLFPDVSPGTIPFDDDALRAEAQSNPHKVRALLQALGSLTPDMTATAWRVINGEPIASLDLHFESGKQFHVKVAVQNSFTDEIRSVESSEVEDATFLRHVGIMRLDNEPVLDGYFPLDSSPE